MELSIVEQAEFPGSGWGWGGRGVGKEINLTREQRNAST